MVHATDVADMVLAHIAKAGEEGITLVELTELTGLPYRVLHNVTWTLEGSPEPSRSSNDFGVPRRPDQIRARRLKTGDRTVRYVATRPGTSSSVDAQALPAPTDVVFTSAADPGSRDGVERPGARADQVWVPHVEAERRRRSAIRLAESVLTADGLTDTHRRKALSLAVWCYTEADGKWNTRYRSRAAVGVSPRRLNHEHVITQKALIAEILGNPSDCSRIMATAVGCCVLREEHARLTGIDRAEPTLMGWQRYAAAGIEVVDLASGHLVTE